MSKNRLIRVIFSLCVILSALPASAQHWKSIGELPGTVTCGYFWDTKSGVVAVMEHGYYLYPFQYSIYMTTDGKTWKSAAPLPPEFHDTSSITSIYFHDRLNGWFTCGRIYADGPGIYSTSDGGMTWSAIPGSKQWDCIKQTSGGTIFTSCGGVAPLNDSVCLISTACCPGWNSSVSINHNYLTTNAGLIWTDLGLFNECWGLNYLKEYNTFTVARDGGNEAFISKDTGKSWNSSIIQGMMPFPYGVTGNVEGSGSSLYVQSLKQGMFRSTDGGLNWKAVDGPSNFADTRFCVIPTCNGNGSDVIAFDTVGGVWLSTDGGDGGVPNEDSAKFTISSISTIRACSEGSAQVKITSNACPNGFSLDTAVLSGDTIHFSLDSISVIPESFGGLISDSFYVRFRPSGQIGKFTATLHISGTNILPNNTTPFDTTIQIIAYSTAVGPQLFDTITSIDFDSLNTCLTGSDTTLTFTNMGCAPDTISASTISGTGFSAAPDSLPIIVPQDSSVMLRVHFQPPSAGSFSGSVNLQIASMGLLENAAITLSGQGIAGKPAMTLSTIALDFGSVSTCGQSVTLPVVINSNGCDTLTGIASNLSDTTIFRVGQASPPAIPVGMGDTVSVTFTPPQSGQFFDTLTISTNAGTGTILLQGIGVADRIALSLPATTLALPQVIAGCGADTASVFFSNAGCKGITIDSVVGLSEPFSMGTISNSSLEANDTANFQIYFNPTAAQQELGATQVFYHSADGISHDTTINISANAIAPPSLSVYLKPASLSAMSQSVVSIPVYASSASSVSGIGTLSFRLDMRTDLLTPESISSPVVGADAAPLQSDKNGTSVSIAFPTNFSLSIETMIATLNCRAYVTDTTATTINLSSASSSGGTNCLSSSGAGAQSFTIVPECGTAELTEFLSAGSPFSIVSIVPNPARDEITMNIECTSAEVSPTVEMYDVLGRPASISSHQPSLISAAISIDVSKLPEGTYYLRLSVGDFTEMRRIVIER